MKDLLPKQLRVNRLWERRKTLEGTLSVAPAERRFEDRLEAPSSQSSLYSLNGVLLNLSESGFAVEVPQKCRFARGESHRLNLKVGSGSVEVDGKVCWTRSVWAESEVSDQSRYRQIAGFELLEPVSHDTVSILGIMRGMVRDSRVGVEVSGFRPLERI